MSWLLVLPLVLQGAVAIADEWCFHRKRGLPAWEVWGHPLDTLTVGICYAFLLGARPESGNLLVYAGLSAFSCLFVTKDEFIHNELCSPQEQWLHSLLFLLHPVAFGAAALLWWRREAFLLLPQVILLLAFLLFQLIYWGKPWRFLSR